jgi:hypothetical protein
MAESVAFSSKSCITGCNNIVLWEVPIHVYKIWYDIKYENMRQILSVVVCKAVCKFWKWFQNATVIPQLVYKNCQKFTVILGAGVKEG